jgi:hypothetical protein
LEISGHVTSGHVTSGVTSGHVINDNEKAPVNWGFSGAITRSRVRID